MKNATILDLKLCNKVLSKITNDQIVLIYQKLNKHLRLFVYTDATFGSLKDRGSQGWYLIFLVDTDYHCKSLSWQSKRLKQIPRSSLAPETIAALKGIDAAIYIRDIFYELTNHQMLVTLQVTNLFTMPLNQVNTFKTIRNWFCSCEGVDRSKRNWKCWVDKYETTISLSNDEIRC